LNGRVNRHGHPPLSIRYCRLIRCPNYRYICRHSALNQGEGGAITDGKRLNGIGGLVHQIGQVAPLLNV
jgi:hypothetical protein